ncbi:DUF503 domain-containing protein [Candidatus Sumerlaeota bacterium]|nr:DUF503 domain-containing protein [Candidatus Sumerlaeota bacterium]
MHIAFLQVDLHIPHSRSLKDKRSVLKRLINLLRTQHNVAVAEIGHHDAWQSAHLGVVTINNEADDVHRILQRVIGVIGNFDDCDLTDYRIEKL